MPPKQRSKTETRAGALRERIQSYALAYVDQYGLSVVPVDGKLPSVKWLEFQTRRPTRDELLGWQWTGVAIVTGKISNLVVVDCDTMDAARWFYASVAKSPVIARTRRGVHFYFRHPGVPVKNHTRVQGKYDVRADGGLAVAPPSPGREWLRGYAMREVRGLPVFSVEWLPSQRQSSCSTAEPRICHPEKYISAIRAIEGQGGHAQTYKAVSYLREASLSKVEAAMIMARWNLTNAQPPWSDAELAHKLDEVFK